MNPALLSALLDQVARGERPVDEALRELEDLPFRDLGFARVDHHRHLRRGAPEVVLGLGKSAEQIAATRVDAEKAALVVAAVPGARFLAEPRAVVVDWDEARSFVDRGRGVVAVVSAGTSDLPIAEEAALTASMMGSRVERIHDVGVAG